MNMKVRDYFTKDKSEYHRKISVLPEYAEQSAHYMARKLGITESEARDFIRRKFKDGEVDTSKRQCHHLTKNEHGDRYEATMLLREYINTIAKQDLLLAPTLTAYMRPEEKMSVFNEYVDVNANRRKGFKKKEFEAQMEEAHEAMGFYNILQSSVKIKSNSLSGAHGSSGTILYLKSGHSTLTSVCRILTSSSNGNNEKFLAGNRHYWCPQITLDNIIALTNDAKNHDVRGAIDTFNLHIPTVDEVMDCIIRSISPYWINWQAVQHLKNFVRTLTDEEKVFFTYGADFYHLAIHNEELVKGFLGKLILTPTVPDHNPEEILKACNDDVVALASLVNAERMKGIQLDLLKPENYDKYVKACLSAEKVPNTSDYNAETYLLVAAAARNIAKTLDEYGLLIHSLYCPNLLPPSFAEMPTMYRRAVPTSDTDSSIFTNQWWVKWYNGRYGFGGDCDKIGYTMTFFITQTVVHVLALLSRNIGLSQDKLDHFQMKNEYYFPVYALTPLAKHYYAMMSAREGNILPKMKKEIKGVNLRNSAASSDIVKRLHGLMDLIMGTVLKEEKLSILQVKTYIAEIEREVYNDIASGGSKFLRTMQIKDEDSYVQKENAPAVMHHKLWEEVFGPKYGAAPEMPYRAVSLSLTTNSRNKVSRWMETIEDRALADRLSRWIDRNSKDGISTVRLPEDIVNEIGIPVELLDIAKLRGVVKMIVAPFYIVVASLGLNLLDERGTYMFSDDEWDEIVMPT